MKLHDVREEYKKLALSESDIDSNPFKQFKLWLTQASEAAGPYYNAMTFSTVDERGYPHSRIVLLKDFRDGEGLYFYTNYESDKSKQVSHHNKACINFYWENLERQVRILGTLEKASEQNSDEYFASRPRGSQLGAIASDQSSIITKEQLDQKMQELEVKYPQGSTIPRPKNWGGLILKPSYFEFWQGRPNRVHDRLCYEQNDNEWKIFRRAP